MMADLGLSLEQRLNFCCDEVGDIEMWIRLIAGDCIDPHDLDEATLAELRELTNYRNLVACWLTLAARLRRVAEQLDKIRMHEDLTGLVVDLKAALNRCDAN
jgi:hypothetical protein